MTIGPLKSSLIPNINSHDTVPAVPQNEEVKTASTAGECYIKPFRVDGAELMCQKDSYGNRYVLCNQPHTNSVHTNITTLIAEVPCLSKNENSLAFATLVNFLSNGEQFEVIQDPSTFKTEYKARIERDKYSFDNSLNFLTAYGIFDVEEVTFPYFTKKENRELAVFYAVKRIIPYRVTCKIPAERYCCPHLTYEMLPYCQ